MQSKTPSVSEYMEIIHRPSFKSFHREPTQRRYKASKMILNDEQKRINAQPNPNATTYFSISAPPSLKPLRKYCDITGLPTTYKSPHNQIRYYDAECYEIVKSMPSGVDQQYLTLRGDNIVLK
ncbi:Ies6 protein [Martiniozyma asiatica (nom. inval.)]|nr:Ies6 protein [Martiniozyma asiatica]